jgi:hypothetical protein
MSLPVNVFHLDKLDLYQFIHYLFYYLCISRQGLALRSIEISGVHYLIYITTKRARVMHLWSTQ